MATASPRLTGTIALLDVLPVSGADPETVAANFPADPDTVRDRLERAASDGLVTESDGVYQLTDEGQAIL